MFPEAVFQPEWLHQQRKQLGNCDPAILEKCVFALTLLGYLVESGLPFLFKGGTSLLLHLPEVRRLSRDIDIVCGSPATEVDAVVAALGQRAPLFTLGGGQPGSTRPAAAPPLQVFLPVSAARKGRAGGAAGRGGRVS